MNDKLIDHLFRHQFGKMVSILTRIFGLEHLETIEDAVQDSFIQAIKSWRTQIPENPEAWLTKVAKNRMLDIFRSINAENKRKENFQSGPASLSISELFLEDEIEDSQLRMIFTACHPILDPKEQIAFALRSVSGFDAKEIASSLLSKPETIKKRLQRARKTIVDKSISFEIPSGQDLKQRLDRVLEVVYLIFNEGFHSSKKDLLLRKELCGEALRLNKLLLKKTDLRSSNCYALFALLCFHSARLDSKISEEGDLINIRDQDRTKWHFPLINLGNEAMNKAVENEETYSAFHYEAAIASEHLRAESFEMTNWKIILKWYQSLNQIHESASNYLNIAIVYLQLNELDEAHEILSQIEFKHLNQRQYLYYATLAKYYELKKDFSRAIANMEIAIGQVKNKIEKKYFLSRLKELENKSQA